MLLDDLKDFNWLNEPENVRFSEAAMEISAKRQSEFWQHGSGQGKDNGHFFYSPKNKNFLLRLQWQTDDFPQQAQAGIMLRIDEKNWFKAAAVKTSQGSRICTSLTLNGYSDWAEISVPEDMNDYRFSLRRRGEDYLASFELDGKEIPLRMFHLAGSESKAGAYICSPGNAPAEAFLKNMAFGAS